MAVPRSAAASLTPGLAFDHISSFRLFASEAVSLMIVVTDGAGPVGNGVV
jgi:hypothetical protein